MKKIFTLVCFALATISANAQYNLFDAADCDADGWLWLDTQEKIDKYVGPCDETNYSVDPNGKPIQYAFGYQTPDYPESYVHPDVMGTDSKGKVEGDDGYNAEESKKGAVVIAPSSALMTANGGCLILNLPCCSTISLFMSSESNYSGRLLMLTPGKSLIVDDSTGENAWTGSTKAIYTPMLLSLHGAKGQWTWTGIESLNNGYNTDYSFKSNDPVYFCLQNARKAEIYVHGIKVTTPTPAGIQQISTEANGTAQVYSLDGRKLQGTVRGLNIIRQNGVTRKVIK